MALESTPRVAASAILVLAFTSQSALAQGTGRNACASGALLVSATHDAPDAKTSWTLDVDRNGSAVVHMISGDHKFQLSAKQCSDLVALLKQERYLDLAGAYGVSAIDGAIREIHITLSGREHSLILYEELEAERDRPAVKRALRVWVKLRSLFDVPGAADSRKRDLEVIGRRMPVTP